MLLILCTWIVTGWISFLAGHFVSWLIARTAKVSLTTSFPVLVLAGFAALSAFTSWLSLFLPITTGLFLGIAIVLNTWYLAKRHDIHQLFLLYRSQLSQRNKMLPFLFALALVTGLAYCAAPTKCYDEGLYYVQTIKWYNAYPVVPGLGNLESRLAMNSAWHVLTALFNFSSQKAYYFDDINGLLFVVIILFALEGIDRLMKGNYSLSNLLRAMLIFPNFLFYFSIMGPAADLVITYYSWVIFVLFLEWIDANYQLATTGWLHDDYRKTDERIIILFAVFLLTVKFSAFTIFPIIAYFFLKNFSVKKSIGIVSVGLFFLLPWMLRNYILSGFIVFPVANINFFHPDWKMSEEAVRSITCAAEGWAKIPLKPCHEVQALSIPQWLPTWFAARKIYDKLIFILLILSLLLSFLHLLLKLVQGKGLFIRQTRGYIVLHWSMLAGIIVWFFKAPDFRFGYGPILCYIICTTAILGRNILLRIPPLFLKRLSRPLAVAPFVIMILMLLILEKGSSAITSHILAPAALPEAKVHEENFNNLKIIYPFDMSQCWDSDMPCTTAIPSSRLHLRKAGDLASGFSIE